MSKKIEIVDLFAGPGGLGEGFSAAGRETATPMSIRLSVEKDGFAIQTLRLRAFLRSFENGFPAAYYEALSQAAGQRRTAGAPVRSSPQGSQEQRR